MDVGLGRISGWGDVSLGIWDWRYGIEVGILGYGFRDIGYGTGDMGLGISDWEYGIREKGVGIFYIGLGVLD